MALDTSDLNRWLETYGQTGQPSTESYHPTELGHLQQIIKDN